VRGRQRVQRGHLGSLFWRFALLASSFLLLCPFLLFFAFSLFFKKFGTFLAVRFRPFLFLQAGREEAAASKKRK
jgi:hypothetical protein